MISTTARYVMSLVISIMIITVTADITKSLDEKVRLETIEAVSNRVESVTLMMSGLEEDASTELRLEHEYGINKIGGDAYLNYTVGSVVLSSFQSSSESELEDPYGQNVYVETGVSEYICVSSEGYKSARVSPGRCNN